MIYVITTSILSRFRLFMIFIFVDHMWAQYDIDITMRLLSGFSHHSVYHLLRHLQTICRYLCASSDTLHCHKYSRSITRNTSTNTNTNTIHCHRVCAGGEKGEELILTLSLICFKNKLAKLVDAISYLQI